jgi:hypothetical protein|tara:strand:+ start:153 stop:335 length:183 start_codon:yes stop_codon:yes gene_type:complete
MKNTNFKPVSVPVSTYNQLDAISNSTKRSKSDTLRIVIAYTTENGMPEISPKMLEIMDKN